MTDGRRSAGGPAEREGPGGGWEGRERSLARLDPDGVRRLARLARLEFVEAEVERLAEELSDILGRFDALAAAEAAAGEGVSPPAAGRPEAGRPDGSPPGEGASSTRPDVPGADPLAFGPGRLAPDWRGGFFVVPGLPGLAEGAGPEAGAAGEGNGEPGRRGEAGRGRSAPGDG